MNRNVISTTRGKIGGGLHAVARLCSLHTPALSTWHVYEWEVFERDHLIEHGSFPQGEHFLIADDVFDQLTYKFETGFETVAAGDSPSDADPGL